ncbi:MAG: hypothetical protein N2316_07500 [Spirochaetes bacterium]|nr:hypothetical protein [Spirochaetota bacterium]
MWSWAKKKYPIIYPAGTHAISHALIDTDVLRIMKRLRNNGYDAYLVGGSIRDILLGKRVKDFDIVTDAHPHQIKRLFKRCFLVGKRFRLAHVYVNRERFVEVATFRAIAMPDEIKSDKKYAANNIFGTIEEDALRRDFTINALYYNSVDGSIEDYTGGMDDIKKRLLRCIGNPINKFTEDPVRIIRAGRLSAQLNFSIPRTEKRAAIKCAPLIREANANRLLEELYKILRCGASAKTFENLKQLHALQHWLSEIAQCANLDFFIKRLTALDDRINAGEKFGNPILIAVLLFDLFEEAVGHDTEEINHQEIINCIRARYNSLAHRMRIPRKDWDIITNISARIWTLKRIGRIRKKREAKFVCNQYFDDSLKLFEIYAEAKGYPASFVQYWKQRQKEYAYKMHNRARYRHHDSGEIKNFKKKKLYRKRIKKINTS